MVRHFLLPAVTLVASAIAIAVLFFYSPLIQLPASAIDSSESLMLTSMENIGPMNEKQAEKIVEHAMRYESAVIFCHADWHMTSQVTRPDFARLVVAYHRTYPEQEIGFHYLNLTEARSKPLLLIPNPEEIRLVGSSYLIWLREGQLATARFLGIDEDIDDLVEATRSYTERRRTMR